MGVRERRARDEREEGSREDREYESKIDIYAFCSLN